MCAAPATARVAESNGSRVWPLWIGLIVTLAIQLCGFSYGFGRLTAQVESLRLDVQILQSDIRAIRGAK